MKAYEELILTAQSCGITKEILNSAIINRGNNSRLKKFFEKLQNNESVTVGFLGGSITYGSNSTTGNCFADLVTNWLNAQFENANITSVNAGFGGTGSIIGFYRMDGELIKYKPDLTFIDFTVNDALENKRDGIIPNESYEGVIRRTLESGSAVVVLGFCDKDKTTFKDLHLEVAKHYDLSFVSMVDSIYPLIYKGDFKWEDYSNDSVHPIDFGHKLISLLIENFLIKELNSSSGGVYSLPDKINKDVLENPNTFDYFTLPVTDYGSFKKYDGYLRLKNGFVSDGDLPITFNLEDVKKLYLVVLYSNQDNIGRALLEINGEKQTVDCHFRNGWGSKPLAVNVFSSDMPKNISVKLYSDSKDKSVIILRVCKS